MASIDSVAQAEVVAPVSSSDPWDGYLGRFHRDRPGITETTFSRARNLEVGDPYDWLTAALPRVASRVLDLGCGSSPIQGHLPLGSTYVGIDLSADELRVGRELGRGPTSRADARAIPLATSSVDVVVSSMSLMLVTPVDAALAECARVLRRGGRLVVLLPSAWPLVLSDVPVLTSLVVTLRGPGSMPQRLPRRRAARLAAVHGLDLVSAETRRFALPVDDAAAAELAVDMLYTPGRDQAQLHRARRRLARMARPGRELPLPLLRLAFRRR